MNIQVTKKLQVFQVWTNEKTKQKTQPCYKTIKTLQKTNN